MYQESIDGRLSQQPSEMDSMEGNSCEPHRGEHTRDCGSNYELGVCVVLEAEHADKQNRRLRKAHLIKDCARCPAKADRKDYDTLDGLASPRSVILHK